MGQPKMHWNWDIKKQKPVCCRTVPSRFFIVSSIFPAVEKRSREEEREREREGKTWRTLERERMRDKEKKRKTANMKLYRPL